MPHHCKALVFHCIDFRFGKAIEKYLEEKNLLGDCDIVAAAGAVKNLVSPKEKSDAEFVLRQIGISKKLHEIQEVMLINHTDCGAYGGASAFTDDSEEFAKHSEDLKKAKEMIREEFPDLGIRMTVARIDASGKIRFEEIK